MSISITKTDIKRKCRISTSDTTYDSDIDALIVDMQPSVECTIADKYLNDTGNTTLQAVLKLGVTEIISGEFLQQIGRESGASEVLTIGSIGIGAAPDHGARLIAQGTARLQPFRKAIDGLASEAGVSSTTSNTDRTFTRESMEGW